jgi:hypothetical protein
MLKAKFFIKKINLVKFFNDKPTIPAPTGAAAGQVGQATPPPKSKEELKVEKLMEQWPEYIRNPEFPDHKMQKEYLEKTYKFHQGDKPYIKDYDLPENLAEEVKADTYYALTTDNIIDLFKSNEGFITDTILADKFYNICNTHKELTPEFFSYLMPIIKKTVAKADRHSNKVLALIATGAAQINLGDKEFWDIMVYITKYRNLS